MVLNGVSNAVFIICFHQVKDQTMRKAARIDNIGDMHFFHPLDECCRYGMLYLKGNIINDHNAYCMG